MLPGIVITLPCHNKSRGKEYVNEEDFKYIKNYIFILFHTAYVVDSQKESRSSPGQVEIQDQYNIIILLHFLYGVEFKEVREQESQID
jgi:hypothetical protein